MRHEKPVWRRILATRIHMKRRARRQIAFAASTPPHTGSGGGRGGTPHGWRAAWNGGSAQRSTMSKSAAASRSNDCFLAVAPPLPAAGDTSLLASCRHEFLATLQRATQDPSVAWLNSLSYMLWQAVASFPLLLFHVEKQEPSFLHDDVETCQTARLSSAGKIQS